MTKDIRQFYEEYKKGMDNFKKEEEKIKSEQFDEKKKKKKLDKLLEKKLKFQKKFAAPFLKGVKRKDKNE